ncbi:F0F1 ATP synthase subunit gamma [Limibacillus halophilus]|uniref:ATP synthase gamma chain n=1 Tax=Limibacillus halophilus TaxID=1579333 RepID=A0A839SY23_9PROT|nr:F0F1 ATP synthase subunit gamma [Limibacillus halophilus]MBB3066436.1 F-type H+-transporting ATPase subunit gamma [Limibacillus halophilus]
MPSLKEFRNRIASVKSTQKITSAMKMVAAAKLRKAQEQAEASRPYAERMARMLGSLAESVKGTPGAPPMLAGNGKDDVHLIILATADRGLCGGFNTSIVRDARRRIEKLKAAGKTVKILCLGRKGRDQLRRVYGESIIETIEDMNRPMVNFDKVADVSERVTQMFENGEFDVCSIFYARFKSAMTQIVTEQQLIPFQGDEADEDDKSDEQGDGAAAVGGAVYEYEPNEEQILKELLPRNLAVQIFKALLENNASEHGARMTAMDSATRNAGDMIDSLTLRYNRTRQAVITKELIEIISAKEAL